MTVSHNILVVVHCTIITRRYVAYFLKLCYRGSMHDRK